MAILSIRLYGKDEEYREYTRGFVPWKLLKNAMKLAKRLGKAGVEELDDETVDDLGQLVVDAFGGQFSLEALSEGADLGEMMSVLKQIVAMASGRNPTPPGQ
ncbi:MAG: phage tail assembly chaperone G [Anaerolineae bacterium]